MRGVSRCKDCTGWSQGKSGVRARQWVRIVRRLWWPLVFCLITHMKPCGEKKNMHVCTQLTFWHTHQSFLSFLPGALFNNADLSWLISVVWTAETQAAHRRSRGDVMNSFCLPSVPEHDIVHCKQHVLCKCLSCQVSRVWPVVQALQEVQVLQGWDFNTFYEDQVDLIYFLWFANSTLHSNGKLLQENKKILNTTNLKHETQLKVRVRKSGQRVHQQSYREVSAQMPMTCKTEGGAEVGQMTWTCFKTVIFGHGPTQIRC